jgi:hypothetical protein
MPGEPLAADPNPLLPQGIVLFESLPMRAVVIEALGSAVLDGAVVIREGDRAGVVLIRDGSVDDAFAFDAGSRWRGEAALQRIGDWRDAIVSARRLDPTSLDIVRALYAGTACYDDLRLEWTDVRRLLDDLRRRSGAYVVELTSAAGRAVTAFRGGEHLLTYTPSAIGSQSLIDELIDQGTGSVRVVRFETDSPATLDTAMVTLFGRPQPVLTAHAVAEQRARLRESRQIHSLAPELAALAHRHLRRSSNRVDTLIGEAMAGGESIETLARSVRETAIRGVMPSRMHALADEMLILAEPQKLGQNFLPA